jgi:hypothetical protein
MEKKEQRLIGVSGKMGSGKDTVGAIILALTSREFENFSYNTVSELICQNKMHLFTSDWSIKKMADNLKRIASILSGVPAHMFESQDFKKSKMDPEWGDITYREFLQKIGTEALRNNLHTNVWCNSLFSNYVDSSKWVVTDIRFPNEAESIKEHKGLLIRVNTTRDIVKSDHPSETSLDDYNGFDYVINNSSSILDLIYEVKNILVKEGIIKNPDLIL